MRRSNYSLVLLVSGFFLTSCHPLNRGFEFVGEYEAPRSNFTIQIVARGNIKGGHDISDEAFSLVRICPLSSSTGKSFELALGSSPDGWIKAESKGLGMGSSDWNWKSAEGLFKGMLDSAGFANVASEEVAGGVKVIEGSLSGPKGAILKGQIESLRVLGTKSQYLMTTMNGRPNIDWVQDLYSEPCGEIGTQSAAAPDASRQ